jgi:hypothetical protein
MKRTLPVLLVLLGFGSHFSFTQTLTSSTLQTQSPLDSYIDVLRKHQVNSTAKGFAEQCGVKLEEATHGFAFSNDEAGTWKAVPDLTKAYDGIEMDLVGTAEIWKNSQGTVVEEWNAALDVGGFNRILFCFDKAGRLKSLDSTNYQIPDEGPPWGMHERWILQADGMFHSAIPFEFVGLDDKRIPPPKLDRDYKSFVAGWGKTPPARQSIRELKLPPSLFQ